MGSVVYRLDQLSILAVQSYLVAFNKLSTRVVDYSFAELPPKARKKLARSRQKRVRYQEPAPDAVCTICKSGRKLERHHIIPPRFGGTNVWENILWVCHKCHVKIHGGV